MKIEQEKITREKELLDELRQELYKEEYEANQRRKDQLQREKREK